MRNIEITRRDTLKALGGLAAAALTGSAEAAERKPRRRRRAASQPAGKELKLGVFTSVYASLPLEEAAARIKADGFTGVVFDYHFKDVHFDPLAPDWDALKKIRSTLDRNGIQVAGLYGYYNVIDPDEARRAKGEQRMSLLIKEWKRFGTPIVSTETGSYNKQSEFAEDPKNWTEEGYKACRDALAKHVREAEKSGAIVAIEAYWRNCIDSAEKTERLFRDVSSPSLKLTMDPCNYFRNEDLSRMQPMLEDMFKRVGAQTVLAHAKDVKRSPNGPDLPAAGLGELDYPTYLRLLRGLKKDLFLVIEHLALPDVQRARDYVKSNLAKA